LNSDGSTGERPVNVDIVLAVMNALMFMRNLRPEFIEGDEKYKFQKEYIKHECECLVNKGLVNSAYAICNPDKGMFLQLSQASFSYLFRFKQLMEVDQMFSRMLSAFTDYSIDNYPNSNSGYGKL
jgi:hypothetical protein